MPVKLPVLMMLIVFAPALQANSVPPAYIDIALKNNVPPELLYAIALTESKKSHDGRVVPWPWTANVKGKGHYYESRQAMYQALGHELATGNKNVDVGLMQVNWRWNGHRFNSLWDATDPYTNMNVGASLLAELRKSLGSFEAAVGAYHNRVNQEISNKYRARVRRELALLMVGKR